MSIRYNHNVEILLKDVHESYYWIGFILADGCITKTNRLMITLSTKDRHHIEKFANYIQYPKITDSTSETNYGTAVYSRVAVQNQKIVSEIKNKYKISNNKTYEGYNLNIIPSEFRLSLICGYIDGDGRIGNRTTKGKQFPMISFRVHSRWGSFLEQLYQEISIKCNIEPKNHSISKDGYATIHITKTAMMKYLKRHALYNNLPILDRKWSLIDLNTDTQYEKALKAREDISLLRKEGKTYKEIQEQLNCSSTVIWKTIYNK